MWAESKRTEETSHPIKMSNDLDNNFCVYCLVNELNKYNFQSDHNAIRLGYNNLKRVDSAWSGFYDNVHPSRMLGGGLLGRDHLLWLCGRQRLHGSHRLLQEAHVVEAQANLLLQMGLVLDTAGQVLLFDELLLLLLGATVAQAGQGVPIPTQLLLGAALAALVMVAHHVGVIGGIWWWCCSGLNLARRLWLLLLGGLIRPGTEEATLRLWLLRSPLARLLHDEDHIVIGVRILAALSLQGSSEFLVAIVLHCSIG